MKNNDNNYVAPDVGIILLELEGGIAESEIGEFGEPGGAGSGNGGSVVPDDGSWDF